LHSNHPIFSLTTYSEHDKQAAHGWGEETGNGELADEVAGSEIAKAEAKNEPEGFTPDTSGADPAFGNGPDAPTGDADIPEPEDNTKSYTDYLAEQAEKRAAIGGDLAIRKANEGSKQQFPEGKAVNRNTEDYFAGSGGKQSRQKENKSKNLLTMDGQYYAPPAEDRRGGREGGRGGRGRGEGGRGGREGGRGRGDGYRGRGEGRGRGAPRGGAPRGDANSNGPRGGQINVTDESAFPSLG
jgi:plasminogen activator inhibitor 1 RNA-binding protein